MKRYTRTLFIFRRDLRLEDNTGLFFALKSSEQVVPAFIYTPEQLEHNPYRGEASLQFMMESLEDLEESLTRKGGTLFFFSGTPADVVSQCIQKNRIDAVVINRDYTPYSIQRDGAIEAVCKQRGVAFHSFDDALLQPPHSTVKKDGRPYTVFTPFFKKARNLEVLDPVVMPHGRFFEGKVLGGCSPMQWTRRAQASGGRKAALKLLQGLGQLKRYARDRDFPALDATSHLSPHLKYTTCSPREVYHAVVHALGEDSELVRSLYWRDFFTSIGYFFPQVFGSSFHEKFDKIHWSYDEKAFRRWCTGTTGFPIVDAGMRQLEETGELHNRVRMIVASFLVKDLHIDWRWGEKYFAQLLIDYDPAVNNGNWQWVASTGCDAQPYFRIFNPWLQQKKFDSDCLYIKRWVPELRSYPADVIHRWHMENVRPVDSSYPPPILDHAVEAKKSVCAFSSCVTVH